MKKVLVVIDGKSVTLQCDDSGKITVQTLDRVLNHLLGTDRYQLWVSPHSEPQKQPNGQKEKSDD